MKSSFNDLFPTKHDVCGALQAVNDGLATGVEVVVLGLDHRVIHIHRRHQQLVALAQLVESEKSKCWRYIIIRLFTYEPL